LPPSTASVFYSQQTRLQETSPRSAPAPKATIRTISQQGGGGKHKDEQEPPTGPLPDGVVTPHASFLALRFAPREAMANLRALTERFPAIYTPYGFRDSVNLSTGRIADRILALDPGMIRAAIANAPADDFMQHAFSDGAVEQAIRPLIAPEEFTAGPLDEDASEPTG
jgi:hypothetical protein